MALRRGLQGFCFVCYFVAVAAVVQRIERGTPKP
ncbi:MAG: hypothetical protein Greene041679_506 [Parcubacteria group bacterium Greene0416_79]|nr:MAG: hypothetical protein Greene041679_506 [Parcubacteria group bacterium Greene0416_79]